MSMNLKLAIILLLSVFLTSCSNKATNLMDMIAKHETIKATPANTSIGKINKMAPIMKEDVKPATNKQDVYNAQKQTYKNNIEMVGYIVSSQKDTEVDMYLYTFTNALRTKNIQFFSVTPLHYPTSQLIRIEVKDNFLKSHKPYSTTSSVKKKVSTYFDAAKEYIINTK